MSDPYWTPETGAHQSGPITPQPAAPAQGYDPGYTQPPVYPQVAVPVYGYIQPVVPVMPRKEPGISLLASFFIPGLGTMLNGEVGKGIGILVGYFVSCIAIIILIGFVAAPAFWIWGMVDAYQGAQRINRLNGYPN